MVKTRGWLADLSVIHHEKIAARLASAFVHGGAGLVELLVIRVLHAIAPPLPSTAAAPPSRRGRPARQHRPRGSKYATGDESQQAASLSVRSSTRLFVRLLGYPTTGAALLVASRHGSLPLDPDSNMEHVTSSRVGWP